MIIVVGATGHLGSRIVHHLRHHQAKVRALIRPGTASERVHKLKESGAEILPVDFKNKSALVNAMKGGSTIVSAVSGLREVIVDLQTDLLHAAIQAGVTRIIPSDFCIDYSRLPKGRNRNLDLRREFNTLLDQSPIQATSVLNGMFMDLLQGQAPVIIQKIHRVLCYGNPDQPLDFTTLEDTARYTAQVAMDQQTPRCLRVAGQVASPRELVEIASRTFGRRYKLLRPGGLGLLQVLIKITKTLAPQKGEVFPAWQGMQYMHDMMSGETKLQSLDNDRYPGIEWTTIEECLKGDTVNS